MKAWITLPFDDEGIREVEIIGKPDDANLRVREKGRGIIQSHYWYREGVNWHRSYAGALEAANKMRRDRIVNATMEAARVAALTSIPHRRPE